MRHSFTTAASLAVAAALMASSALPASAACTRLGFSVNDYGKDGPTKDAKVLLDKYIAKWATDHGVPKYRTGTKDVKCELFLNFIVFDEHTCRAEATVCWDGAPVTPPVKSADTGDKPADAKPAAPVKRAAVRVAPAAAAASVDKPADAPVVAAKPVAAPAPAAPAAIETGTLPAPAKPAVAVAPAAPPAAAVPKAATADAAIADQAMAAAQKAAAAAERAAAAAERAAAAATAVERANASPAAKP